MKLDTRAERDVALAALGRAWETSRAAIRYARFGEIVVVTDRSLVVGSAWGI